MRVCVCISECVFGFPASVYGLFLQDHTFSQVRYMERDSCKSTLMPNSLALVCGVNEAHHSVLQLCEGEGVIFTQHSLAALFQHRQVPIIGWVHQLEHHVL